VARLTVPDMVWVMVTSAPVAGWPWESVTTPPKPADVLCAYAPDTANSEESINGSSRFVNRLFITSFLSII